MTLRYSRNPLVTFVRVSDDEVIARGGHLDGYSLVIRDDTGRGLAALVTDELDQGGSAEDVHREVSRTVDVTLEEIERFLREMNDSGLAISTGRERASLADWLAFLRFGEIPSAASAYPLVVAGSDAAKLLVERLTGLGLPAEHRSWDDLDVEPFALPDSSDPQAPPDEAERLVVLSDGGSLRALYELNERAVAARAPVLYLQIAGVEWAAGPFVAPGASACFWEFERQRARSMFSYSEYAILAASEPAGGRRPASDAVRYAAIGAATPYLVELSLLGESSLAGQVLRGRATTAETRRHAVMRLPRCPVCLPLRPPIRNPLF